MNVSIDGKSYVFLSGWQDDPQRRSALDKLASAVFGGLSFEKWYQNGFWTDTCVPYTLFQSEKVVAHVLFSEYNIEFKGEKLRLAQVGTVMTDPEYRQNGLGRYVMEKALNECTDFDAVFLFGNDTVLNYYPKFGYVATEQYQYTLKTGKKLAKARQLDMNNPDDRTLIEEKCSHPNFFSAMKFIGALPTVMFHLLYFRCYEIFFIDACDALVIVKNDDGKRVICDVFGGNGYDLCDLAACVTDENEALLGFTPENYTNLKASLYHEDDCTFFVRGKNIFKDCKLFFPLLCHT